MRRQAVVVLVVAGLVGGCQRSEHGHDHGHGHGEAHEGGHRHADEHPAGHDHHAPGHGHDAPVVRITRWGGGFELFAEHAAAVAGKPLEMLAHLTVLEDFSALSGGKVTLQLEGPHSVSVTADAPLRPGIYRLELTPDQPGAYAGTVTVEGEVAGVVAGFEVVVHPAGAKPQPKAHDEAGAISFLKEQQWKVTFATAFVTSGSVSPSVQVPGTVDTPPGGMAEVSAPMGGRLVPPPGGLPRPGQTVRAGQLLANLAPAPSSPEGEARAKLALVEARARVRAAEASVQRAERLIVDEAISRRELEDARRELSVAKESVTAAEQVSGLFAGARSGRGKGSWRLLAPISGVLAKADARPGASVSPSDILFTIVNRDELWLKAKVPEQDAARLQTGLDGHYRVSGLQDWRPLHLGGESPNASLVAVSSVVDPNTRSVEVIYG